MMTLFEALKLEVDEWRQQGHDHADYPAIAEILAWAASPEGKGFRLRAPQWRALETYWYLRLVERTPHIVDLYRRLFPKTADMLRALGVANVAFERVDFDLDALWEVVKTDSDFVGEFRLEALRETLMLGYPSYILALAMGAGKTALIGAIMATEFAMALEYPDGPFVENALVFAPGKTILESLRELAEIPYQCVLPPRLYKSFAASVKLTFTRDGEKDIPVIRGSSFNVVVTNTEKIRIQKEAIRKSDIGNLLEPQKAEEARAEIANLRLQAIASLPHLAVFSDEAHHTYGQKLDTELKKVRKTVDYLAANTNVICVINTTGTPYFRRQPLRDWVLFFLRGVAEQSRDAITRAKRLQDLQSEWRGKLQQARVTGLVLGIADSLFESPLISANAVADRFDVTHQAAMQALRRLEQMGIVEEVSGRQRNRVYRATDIVRIVE
jgi:DNA-binding transcriptional ArsR family regulator